MSSLKAFTAAALLLISTVPVLADAVTYRGTIGKIDVVVEFSSEIEGTDEVIYGRYFYPKKGVDIPLDAVSHKPGSLTVQEEKPCTIEACPMGDDYVPTEFPLGAKWVLKTTDDGETLTGTWSEGKKPLKVALGKVGSRVVNLSDETLTGPIALVDAALSSSYSGIPMTLENDPYDTMRMSMVPLDESDVTDWDGNQFDYATDPRTRFAYPRLVALSDGGDVGAANMYLQNRHWMMNAEALDCSAKQYAGMGWNDILADAAGGLGDYDYETVAVNYLSSSILSWTESGSTWCGGAHPYNHHEFYNLDVKTGQPLDLAAIFSAWVPREYGGGPEVDAATAAENPDGYEWGPNDDFVAFVKARRVKSDDETFESECGIDDLIASNLKISFKEGDRVLLALGSLPNAIVACGSDDLYEAPIADLEEFLTPEAKDYFPSLGG